jgi:hypothetical protein
LNGHVETSVRQDGDDANDDYWAAYDRTPGQTPARTPAKRSPAPYAGNSARPSANQEEQDYYARYGEEVQPALDSHDPDEERGEAVGSVPYSDTLAAVPVPAGPNDTDYYASLQPHTQWNATQQHDSAIATANEQTPEQSYNGLSMPRAISPTASHSSVDRLEDKAAEMEMGSGSDQAQLAIKQHISTDMKSLFRLAKASGMQRAEFERIVRRELDVLSMLDVDE